MYLYEKKKESQSVHFKFFLLELLLSLINITWSKKAANFEHYTAGNAATILTPFGDEATAKGGNNIVVFLDYNSSVAFGAVTVSTINSLLFALLFLTMW